MGKHNRFKVMVVIGTRPEAIKLWPVVQVFKQCAEIDVHVCLSAQHRDMLDMFVQELNIDVDSDLNLMRSGQTLAQLSSRLIPAVDKLLQVEKPDLVVVQGDTTTAALTALTAFYNQTPVAHVEAGLRSGDRYSPFPEEVNRQMVGVIADIHFAPTMQARDNLLAEGVNPKHVWVTGNTVIDAVRQVAQGVPQSATPRVLMTAHRRENFGAPLQAILQGVRAAAEAHPSLVLVYPVHPNPQVKEPVYRILGNTPNIQLCEPLGYHDFVTEMQKAWFMVSDSGGVQEEATALGRPMLLLRNETERPEGLAAGNIQQVELSAAAVTKAMSRMLEDASLRESMAHVSDVFGDGQAAGKILQHTLSFVQARQDK